MILDFARFSTLFPRRFSACSSQPSPPEAAWKVIFTTCLGGEKSLGMEMIKWPMKNTKGMIKTSAPAISGVYQVIMINDPCPDFFELRDSMVTWTCTKTSLTFFDHHVNKKAHTHISHLTSRIISSLPTISFQKETSKVQISILLGKRHYANSFCCYFSGHVKNLARFECWLTSDPNSCPDIPARTLNQYQLMVDCWIWHSIGIPFSNNPLSQGHPRN